MPQCKDCTQHLRLRGRDAKPSLNNSCGYSRFLLSMVASGVARFGLSHIYIKFVKLWRERHQSQKKRPGRIKQKWIVLICSTRKKFYGPLFFAFNSLAFLQQLIRDQQTVYPLVLHTWKPKATSSHGDNGVFSVQTHSVSTELGSCPFPKGPPMKRQGWCTSTVRMRLNCEESRGIIIFFF